MNLALTPQQAFESADRMLIEAVTIRECAAELAERAQRLYSKADTLQATAHNLQQQGAANREKVASIFESLMRTFGLAVEKYELANPGVISKLSLAIEEGRVHLEELEILGNDLKKISRAEQDCDSEEDPIQNATNTQLRSGLFQYVPKNVKIMAEAQNHAMEEFDFATSIPNSSDSDYKSAVAIPGACNMIATTDSSLDGIEEQMKKSNQMNQSEKGISRTVAEQAGSGGKVIKKRRLQIFSPRETSLLNQAHVNSDLVNRPQGTRKKNRMRKAKKTDIETHG